MTWAFFSLPMHFFCNETTDNRTHGVEDPVDNIARAPHVHLFLQNFDNPSEDYYCQCYSTHYASRSRGSLSVYGYISCHAPGNASEHKQMRDFVGPGEKRYVVVGKRLRRQGEPKQQKDGYRCEQAERKTGYQD